MRQFLTGNHAVAEAVRLCRPDVVAAYPITPQTSIYEKLSEWEATDELGGLQFLEVRSSLPDELLMYGDKLSMAHGLEARVPFLDQEIVQYAERLSASFKVRGGSRKWLHRRVCNRYLPAAHRPRHISRRCSLRRQNPRGAVPRNGNPHP